PQVWAWKKWRLRQLPALVDRMICIFDFEEAIYREAGIPAEYVGHPLVETAAPRLSRDQFFSQFQLDPTLPTVALLPGSRQIELQYILPTLLRAARQLSAARQELQFVLAAAPTLNAAWLETRLRDRLDARRPVRVVTDATYDALAYSTLAVVASGTATIEAAILGCPMVVVYRVAPLTAFFARRMVDVPFFSMVNLLAGQKVVEELIQDDFTAPRLAAAVTRLLDHPELQSKMKEELRAVKSRLGVPGAIERAADSILEMLQSV
ncbi:MAG: lipid-A-disaccharide synthase, partial [Terriglobia bacterium]